MVITFYVQFSLCILTFNIREGIKPAVQYTQIAFSFSFNFTNQWIYQHNTHRFWPHKPINILSIHNQYREFLIASVCVCMRVNLHKSSTNREHGKCVKLNCHTTACQWLRIWRNSFSPLVYSLSLPTLYITFKYNIVGNYHTICAFCHAYATQRSICN